MLFKLFVLVLLFSVISSLAVGLFYLVRDKGSTERTVRALTMRIAISVALFALLMITFFIMNWVMPRFT